MSPHRSGIKKHWLGLLLGLGAAVALLTAGGDAAAIKQDPAVAGIARLPGRVVARGENQRPSGALKLRTWRIEEIRFAPVRVTVRGRTVETDRAWRLVLLGEAFPVRDMPAIVWVGEEALGIGMENADLSELSAITFDPDALRDGATLALSYGEQGAKSIVPDRLAVSQRLGEGSAPRPSRPRQK